MQVVSRKEIDRRWTEWRVRQVEASRRKHEARVKGLDLVLRLDDGRKLEFRGRHYGVPPVPWPVAMEILRVQERFDAIRASKTPDITEWARVLKDIAKLFKKVAHPEGEGFRGRVARVLWPFTPSPIIGATFVEVGKAIGFFSMCLMLDGRELSLRPVQPEHLRPSSSTPNSGASSNGSRSGATRRGARGRGNTSSSDSGR